MSDIGGIDGITAEVLYSAEVVHDGGAYTLVVRDLVRGTLQTTTLPQRTVKKIPMYLCMLDLERR